MIFLLVGIVIYFLPFVIGLWIYFKSYRGKGINRRLFVFAAVWVLICLCYANTIAPMIMFSIF